MSRGSRTRDADYIRDDRRPRVPEASSLDSRIFIGGVNSKHLSTRDIDSWLGKYGTIIDVAFFDRHVLVQFDRESEAAKAIDREKGQSFRGTRVDLRFAHSSDGSMSRSEVTRSRSPRNLPYERDPRDNSPRRESLRERSPEDRDRYYKERRANSPDYRGQERSRNPMEERSRIPLEEAPRHGLEERSRSNTRQELAANEIRDPNWNVSPAVSKVPVERASFDAAIVVMSSDLLNYAEVIETKFQRQSTLSTHIIVLKEEGHVTACIDDLEKKGVLYAFVVNHVNEKHSSCTLRILHGTKQEHRNMLLANALQFVSKNYEEYLKAHRELKPAAGKSNFDPSRMPPGFTPPDDKIIYQLHLLADSRMLTLDELNEVDEFIQKRIQVLAETEGAVEKPNAIGFGKRDDLPMNAAMNMMPHSSMPMQSQMLGNNMMEKEAIMLQKNKEQFYPITGMSLPGNVLHNASVNQAIDTLMHSQFRANNVPETGVVDDVSYQSMGNQSMNTQYMGHNMAQNMVAQNMIRGATGGGAALRAMQPGNPYAATYTGFYTQPQVTAQVAPGQPMYRPRQQQFQGNMANYPGGY